MRILTLVAFVVSLVNIVSDVLHLSKGRGKSKNNKNKKNKK